MGAMCVGTDAGLTMTRWIRQRRLEQEPRGPHRTLKPLSVSIGVGLTRSPSRAGS